MFLNNNGQYKCSLKKRCKLQMALFSVWRNIINQHIPLVPDHAYEDIHRLKKHIINATVPRNLTNPLWNIQWFDIYRENIFSYILKVRKSVIFHFECTTYLGGHARWTWRYIRTTEGLWSIKFAPSHPISTGIKIRWQK